MKTTTTRIQPASRRDGQDDRPAVPLITPLSMHCYIIALARAFDSAMAEAMQQVEEPDGPRDLDDALNACDRLAVDDSPGDDLRAALKLLNEEQLQEVAALLWLGRGDYDRASWRQALQAGRDIGDERDLDVYVVGTPLLADYLEEGLLALGHDCADADRLPL
jgi:hypothetical protein